MKKFKQTMLALTTALTIVAVLSIGNVTTVYAQKDTTSVVTISGKVVDKESEDPVIFTNVYIEGTNVGTVSNADGEFIIKIPESRMNENLGFSNIGYKSLVLPLESLRKKENVIMLQAATIPINEVKIRTDDPVELLRAALNRVPENYYTVPEKMTAFYRETIKENRHYVAVSEAIMQVYKAPYDKLENDQVKIFKGRKSQDVKNMDTVLFKLQGGPTTMVMLDVVKNPSILLGEDIIEFYEYKLAGVLNVNDRQSYVIEFDQKDNVDYPLYSGKLYLDVEDLAITGLEFNLSEKGIDKAANVLVRKKPLTMRVEPLGAYYLVNYREVDDKWYLNHARTELVIKCKWKKRLFNKTYTAMSEMAVTDRRLEDVDRFRNREIAKPNDVFIDNVVEYYDEDFWGDFNYIKPEESIEEAVERINKRLNRRNN